MATTKFLAKIQLRRTGPLTYTGHGRTFTRGVTIITTTDPEEAAYFRAQAGFSVEIKKGKLASPVSKAPDDDDIDDEEDTEDAEDAEDAEEGDDDEEREEEVEGLYEEADLKKLNKKDLIALIDDDDDLDLKSKDLKTSAKAEIVEAIMEAQGDPEDEDDD